MKPDTLSKQYDSLTPEERFELILAAGGRGDCTEQQRLTRTCGEMKLCWQDHAPYAQAFKDVARYVYLELLEVTHHYLQAVDRADRDAENEDKKPQPSIELPHLDLALASGSILQTTAAGWKLFCQRRHVPPFALWEGLPGFERLQSALALSENAAFTPEGFLRWHNAQRPAGAPERSVDLITADGLAEAHEAAFQRQIHWWSRTSS